MNKQTNDGGPAFPSIEQGLADPRMWFTRDGMSLRDYFAGQALVGLLAEDAEAYTWEKLAEASYKAADAMLKAREEVVK